MHPQPRPGGLNSPEWTLKKVAAYTAGAAAIAYAAFGDIPPKIPGPVEAVENFVFGDSSDCYYADTANELRIGSMVLVMVEPHEFDQARDTMSANFISNWSITTSESSLTDTATYAGEQLFVGDATRALMDDVSEATGVSRITFALDEEGGVVQRTGNLSGFPDIAAAADQDPSNIYATFQNHGENLSEQLGVTMVFGPVTDINQGGSIGNRSYGSNAEEVIADASRVISGLHEAGVDSVTKHYPGYGSVVADTHIDVGHTVDFASLQSNELAVHQQLISTASPDGLMASHAITDGLTNGRPASISPEVYSLAESQGFNGVMITDALNMGGLLNYLGYEAGSDEGQAEAAILAVQAGADIVIVELEAGDDTVAALTQAVADGTISQARIDEASANVFEQKGYELCS